MQERYLGDVQDFVKYALIRHVARGLSIRVGLHWYLTHPDAVDRPGNSDGRQRGYRLDPRWAGVDDALRAALPAFDGATLAAFEARGTLPHGSCFFAEPVPCDDRRAWHDRALAALAPAGLVFLDPDNGFAVRSASRRRLPKYAHVAEAAAYLRRGQALIVTQFARQCDVVAKARATRDALMGAAHGAASLPVLRCRVAPTILFVAAAPVAMAAPLREALVAFAARSDRFSLID